MSEQAAKSSESNEESEDFHRMREFDKEWSGPRLVMLGFVTLGVALPVIYGLASMGSG